MFASVGGGKRGSRKAPRLVCVWSFKRLAPGPSQPIHHAALNVQIVFCGRARVPTMSQQQADDGQLASADNSPKPYGYLAYSLLGRVQPAPEIPEDPFSLSGPVSRAYRSLDPVSDPNHFSQHGSCKRSIPLLGLPPRRP